MTITDDHIIKKQVLDISASSIEQAEEIQLSMLDMLEYDIAPMLTQYCEHNGSDEVWICIDELRLDLGMINLDSSWRDKLIRQFDDALKEYFIFSQETHPIEEDKKEIITISSEARIIKAWLYFIDFGWLPWWKKIDSWEAFEKEILSAISSTVASGWRAETIARINKIEKNYGRLVCQSSDTFLKNLLKQLAQHVQAELEMWQSILKAINLRNHQRISYWLILLKIATQAPTDWVKKEITDLANTILSLASSNSISHKNIQLLSRQIPDSAFLEQYIWPLSKGIIQIKTADAKAKLFQKEWCELMQYWSESRQLRLPDEIYDVINTDADVITPDGNTTDKDVAKDSRTDAGKFFNAGESEHQDRPTNKHLSPSLEDVHHQQNQDDRLKKAPYTGHHNPDGETGDHIESEYPTEDLKPDSLYSSDASRQGDTINLDKQTGIDVEPWNKRKGQKGKRAISNDNKHLSALKEGVFVDHAGLVLLHPYLTRFFTHLGYLKDKMFIDDNAQHCALSMLHYLATGKMEAAEYQLLVPKVLCAWTLEDPSMPYPAFTKKEREQAEQLLTAVIANWPVMKNTSIEALQEGFLQRSGKLQWMEDGWKIWIEQKGQDILLSRLPWPVSFISLPWLEKPVRVDWA